MTIAADAEIARLKDDLKYAINALAEETLRRLDRDKFIVDAGLWDEFVATMLLKEQQASLDNNV